ncbi:MAG TPA: hypothetical protein VF212_12160 [Longimicrobiales bacterium]
MRHLPLPLVSLLAACAASDAAEPVLIEDFLERSAAVHCEAAPALSARESVVEDVVTVSDSTFLVLYGQDREVVLVGPDLAPRWVVPFTEDGPTGVRRPVSAALVGDTLLYVADQYRQVLKRLGLDGRDLGAVRLPFPPQRVQAVGRGVYVTPFVLGRHPDRLVFRVEGEEVRALAIPTLAYADPGMNVLANTAVVSVFPDGGVVVTHEFLVPFAHRFRVDAEESVRRVPIPLPEAVGSALRRPPVRTLEETAPADLPVAVLSAAPDVRTGDLVYLTRSGRTTADGTLEKAIVRLDRELRYRGSYVLDVNAIRMAYLAARGVAAVVDDLDRWYTCPAA